MHLFAGSRQQIGGVALGPRLNTWMVAPVFKIAIACVVDKGLKSVVRSFQNVSRIEIFKLRIVGTCEADLEVGVLILPERALKTA
jgi:hypothetical protein